MPPISELDYSNIDLKYSFETVYWIYGSRELLRQLGVSFLGEMCLLCGGSSVVERLLPKQDVAGSIPVLRSSSQNSA